MRLFFDTFDGLTEVRDVIGLEIEQENLEQVAFEVLPELARDFSNGTPQLVWVRVRNEAGEAIYEASLALHTCRFTS
ncbi:hypothetical protein M8994_16425 [Brucella sp. 21LCYQ03]|nr:hypothetical protein [Brucella sp. 21LCYQ03]